MSTSPSNITNSTTLVPDVPRGPLSAGIVRYQVQLADPLTPTSLEEESIVQPGFLVDELSPLSGELITSDTVDVGAYGAVFVGTWKSELGKTAHVAIKIIRRLPGDWDKDAEERLRQRMRRETLIWKALHHPNILPFFGYQIANGEPVLVSPWCQNGSLIKFIREHPSTEEHLRLRLLLDAARGLEYLHSRVPAIIHGDIKPENVLIRDDMCGALCDFGLSRALDTSEDRVGIRGSGLGPVGYQAKELLLGISQSTTMSDVYAFGGLSIAAMSGKPPFFKKRTSAAVILAICRDETARPADHPEFPAGDILWDLSRNCWNPEPGSRPSIGEIISELEIEKKRRSPPGKGSEVKAPQTTNAY